MIKNETRYDHVDKKWMILPALTFKSKHNSWTRGMYSVVSNQYNYCKTTNGAPSLGPKCLTVWSK